MKCRSLCVLTVVSMSMFLSSCVTPESSTGSADRQGTAQTAAAAVRSERLPRADLDTASALHVTVNAADAAVRINGRFTGYAPLRAEELSDGHHLLEISADGYADYSQWIRLEAGTELRLQIDQRLLGGFLAVETMPDTEAEITVAGIGRYDPEMLLPQGSHTLRIRAFGYDEVLRTVYIQDGATTQLSVELIPVGFSIINIQLLRDEVSRLDTAGLSANTVSISAAAPGTATIRIRNADTHEVHYVQRYMCTRRLQSIPLPSADTLQLPAGLYVVEADDGKHVQIQSFRVSPGPLRTLPRGGFSAGYGIYGASRPANSIATAIYSAYMGKQGQMLYRYNLQYGLGHGWELGLQGFLHSPIAADAPANGIGYGGSADIGYAIPEDVLPGDMFHITALAGAGTGQSPLSFFNTGPTAEIGVQTALVWDPAQKVRMTAAVSPLMVISDSRVHPQLHGGFGIDYHMLTLRMSGEGDIRFQNYPHIPEGMIDVDLHMHLNSGLATAVIGIHASAALPVSEAQWGIIPGASFGIVY
ncbi:MAG: PEGA domain-containing protein [Spirochaeta sp.]